MKIVTKRLYFRKWNFDDADFCVDGLNDYDVAKNLTSPFPYTKQDAISFIEKRLNDNDKNFYFAVIRKDDNRIIGGTNISINENGEFRGGFWVHRDYQGNGYGTEIFIARAKFVFDILGANELRNGYHYFNERSWKIQNKMGYKIVGESEHFCPALKGNVKEIVTKLKKSDFEKFYKTIDFEFSVQ